MSRISRDDMLMEVAHVVAKRGTCSRLQVGAVFSREGRIIATGYNGAPAGLPHCDHSRDVRIDSFNGSRHISGAFSVDAIEAVKRERLEDGCQTAEHAERNAIAFAAKHGLALDQGELHVTHAPCLACARSVINSGIVRVSYEVPYRKVEGIRLLEQAGIEVVYMGLPF